MGLTVHAPKRILRLLAVLAVPTVCSAGEGGGSNYIPAFYGDLALAVAPPEGLSIRNDIFFFAGDADRSVRSGLLEARADVDLIFNYLTVLYRPRVEFLGGAIAFSATGALASADIDTSIRAGRTTREAADDHVGLGDLTLGAFLYRQHDQFHFSWATYVVAPIGDYDVDDLANTGLNYWTFETDLMVTYLNEETGQDYSVVVGYGYNTENDDTNYKTGDEFHVDYVFNQHLSDSFGVGVTGYYFRQLSGDSGSGAILGDFRGEAAGIGSVLYWNTRIADKPVYFSTKWIHDFHARNRLETDYVYASFSLSF